MTSLKSLSLFCVCCFSNLSFLAVTPKPLGAVPQTAIRPTTETAIRSLANARLGVPTVPFSVNGVTYFYKLNWKSIDDQGSYNSSFTLGASFSSSYMVAPNATSVSIHQTKAFLDTSYFTTASVAIPQVLFYQIAFTFGAISSGDLISSTATIPQCGYLSYSQDYTTANETGTFDISALAIPYPLSVNMTDYSKTFSAKLRYDKFMLGSSEPCETAYVNAIYHFNGRKEIVTSMGTHTPAVYA